MTYYETIKPMELYKAHKVKDIEVIDDKSLYFRSAWLRITTDTLRTFYIEKHNLDFMQDHPEMFPLEEKKRFAPAQTEKGSGAGRRPDTANRLNNSFLEDSYIIRGS